MRLDQIFGKQEKVGEEKTLETVSVGDALTEDLFAYFYKTLGPVPVTIDASPKKAFDRYMKDLPIYAITPIIIKGLVKKLIRAHGEVPPYYMVGQQCAFLTALIQTSYNQGRNNFVFDRLVYTNSFGSCLEGKKENKIRIKIKKLCGTQNFEQAKNIALCIEDELWGMSNMTDSENIFADVRNMEANASFMAVKNLVAIFETAKGDNNFHGISNFVVHINLLQLSEGAFGDSRNGILEIGNYDGNLFGFHLNNCKIYSPKLSTRLKLRYQTFIGGGKNNSFHREKIKE